MAERSSACDAGTVALTLNAARLAIALDAIRETGADTCRVIDAWESRTTGDAVQIFVSLGGEGLQRGDRYRTWVVTLNGDGSVQSVDRFSSVACRPS